jgi:hypothetical protein
VQSERHWSFGKTLTGQTWELALARPALALQHGEPFESIVSTTWNTPSRRSCHPSSSMSVRSAYPPVRRSAIQ